MDFSCDSDADLVGYMAEHSADPDFAVAAWGELYERHAGYIFNVVLKAFGDHHLAEEVTAESFRRALRYAKPLEVSGDSDDIRRAVRGWLGKIALNVGRDARRLQAGDPIQADLSDLAAPTAADTEEVESGSDTELVAEALQEVLNDREREVMRELTMWYDADKRESSMPAGAAEMLAARLHTVPDTVRQIRKRALDKIKEYVESHRDEGRRSSP